MGIKLKWVKVLVITLSMKPHDSKEFPFMFSVLKPVVVTLSLFLFLLCVHIFDIFSTLLTIIHCNMSCLYTVCIFIQLI